MITCDSAVGLGIRGGVEREVVNAIGLRLNFGRIHKCVFAAREIHAVLKGHDFLHRHGGGTERRNMQVTETAIRDLCVVNGED